ncbi:hypothetical protein [Rhodococcus sp. T7]|uniref:hypothetical protein n=1 Tax=Rhodococcus sp. T7 TaxID=627444 RepID=UPI00135BCDE2|nr:hypothetical protein [Rhodococcus sp. T7]KAF0957742.1 hypothetical protein MLGJGCBP_09574 [Rhodococcus sp. T7]KAF0959908.1 hypothetical protein MLGJGCBP_06943 [Rhodococcus sp. T7]
MLENADGDAIAVIYRPHRGASEVWYLPEEAAGNLDPFLFAAFREWNEQDPKRFPAAPGWQSDVRWMSAIQEKRYREISDKIGEAATEIERLQRVVADAENALDALSRDAQLSQQRLLTGTDDSLVAAVKEALEGLGFAVVDLDIRLDRNQAKGADLSVSDGDWMAVVEVKGYGKGAKSNDLIKVGRHRRVYERADGEVQRMWYVANSFRFDSPDSRAQILDGADEHVQDFAEDDGLVIDTRDIFLLLKSVESGDRQKAEVRETLKDATGRFTL